MRTLLEDLCWICDCHCAFHARTLTRVHSSRNVFRVSADLSAATYIFGRALAADLQALSHRDEHRCRGTTVIEVAHGVTPFFEHE